MKEALSEAEARLLERALGAAGDTRCLAVEAGIRHRAAAVFTSLMGSQRAMVVADENTFRAAGRDVHDSLCRGGHAVEEPFIFGRDLHAEYPCAEALRAALEPLDVVPVAVGSGTINDLTKLAVHRLNRPYLAVATAASMDGYTASGASITYRGSKQTFDCRAPLAVLADLEVIAGAPEGMNASGFADLMAKCAAGGDWMVAEAAGVEPIDPAIWDMVQSPLRLWLAEPGGIARNEPLYLRRLVHGLMMSGFAMQAAGSSRPASGAEHQFSHLWDMQNHAHNGAAPSHGFKVGIGTLASLALYEDLLDRDVAGIDVERLVRAWLSPRAVEERIAAALGAGELAQRAREETAAKHPTPEILRAQLIRVREAWPALGPRLAGHLLGFAEARDMLREAGCPFEPEHIGISRQRLRLSYEQAYFIRRRFTVLDFAERWGVMGRALENIFGAGGPWPEGTGSRS